MKFKKQVLIIIFTLLFAVSMVSAEEENQAEKKETESLIGTVKKVEEAGKYIYLNIDEDGKDIWLVTMPNFFKEKVAEGDKLEYLGGDIIKGFKSKSLDRTFDSIVFVTKIRSLKEVSSAVEEVEEAMPQNKHRKQLPAMEKKISAPAKGEIEKAREGKNIEEIFSEKDQLNNKEVVLRGKVMKVIKNILAKTWITLQDGTGSSPDNKIIAVISDSVDKGNIVIVKGNLKTDVNLGAGYKYKVLIDEASIIKIEKGLSDEEQ